MVPDECEYTKKLAETSFAYLLRASPSEEVQKFVFLFEVDNDRIFLLLKIFS